MAPPLVAGLIAALLLAVSPSAIAQDAASPVPSQCLAIAESVPEAMPVGFSTVQASVGEEVVITYAGHSSYVIETPAGVRVVTDYSGLYGRDPLPDVVTMNKAHSSHFTRDPDPGIAHVLPGWDDEDPPARHALVVEDVYIRNVPTDIRGWSAMEEGGNSIFIFEVAGLCIGHLGHLHHHLEDAHYAAIGRLDVVMVPIDGGLTLSLDAMSDITSRLQSSIVLPMHRFSTPIGAFAARIGETFQVDHRDSDTFTVSLRTLPRRPTVIILDGV